VRTAGTCDKLYLSELSTKLASLEKSNSQLLNSLNIFSEIENILINIPGHNRKIVKNKLKYVIEKMKDIKILKLTLRLWPEIKILS
jgi:hypothetical protein